jgi:membrane protease YdiL (CAAX protease family)
MQGIPLQQILLNRMVFNLLASVLFAWVYNRTQGSIMVPAMFHASMNTAGTFIPVTIAFIAPLLIIVVFAVVHDRMWRRLPQGSPVVHNLVAGNQQAECQPRRR